MRPAENLFLDSWLPDFCYLRKLVAQLDVPVGKIDNIPVSGLSRLAMTALIVAIIWLGIYPQPILEALKR